jgi:peptide/nickel transport system permease protein
MVMRPDPTISESAALPGHHVPAGGREQDAFGRSHWQTVRFRLLHEATTVTALAICVLFTLIAVLSPLLQKLGLIDPMTFHRELVTGVGSLPSGPLGGVGADHVLGVEPGTGRDLLSRILAGITISLLVAVLATFVSIVAGTVLGIVAGYSGPRTDWTISRFTDLVLSFPSLLMLLTLAPFMVTAMHERLHLPAGPPAQVGFMVVVLGFFGWPYVARIIRGQVLSLKHKDFIEAARSLGAKRGWLYTKEILPHLWAPILVYATLMVPLNIAAEATLGFLGVGVQAPTPSLGSILNDSVAYASADPAYFLFPGGTLALIVLAFNLLGDGLRDALDPRGGERR